MSNGTDFELENVQLLLSRWEKVHAGVNPLSLGLTSSTAGALKSLERAQVERAGTVQTPLFTLISQEEVIASALKLEHNVGGVDQDAQLFLSNRWRSAAGSYSFAELYCGMTKAVYELFRAASFQRVQAAAASGISLMVCSVRPQYFIHAGRKFDLDTAHRTALAITTNVKLGY